MRWRALPVLVACLLWLVPASGRGDDNDIQLWPVVEVNHAVTDRWGAHLQTRMRFDDDVSNADDFLVRPFVSWRALDSVTLNLGYAYIHSFDSDDEHRIWQQAEHQLRWRDLTIANRLRLEERFVENVSGAVVRLRHRLRGTHPIGDSDWYGVVSNEVLANLNNQGEGPVSGFDQSRLRVAIGTGFLGRLRVESGYEWQYVDRRGRSSTDRHVFVIELSLDTGSRP